MAPKTFTPEELAREYLQAVIAILSNPDDINNAVKESQLFRRKEGESVNTGLLELAEQFDEAGMQLDNSFLPYTNEIRTQDEIRKFLRNDLSDWEKIAFVSVYFKAGLDLTFNVNHQLNDPLHRLKMQDRDRAEYIEIIRAIVANELKNTIGMKPHHQSLEPSSLTANKLNSLLSSAEDIGMQATLIFDLERRKKELFSRAKHNPNQKCSQKDEEKIIIVNKTLQAIETYQQKHDGSAMTQAIRAINELDRKRHKGYGKHQTSVLVQRFSRIYTTKITSSAEKIYSLKNMHYTHFGINPSETEQSKDSRYESSRSAILPQSSSSIELEESKSVVSPPASSQARRRGKAN